VADGGNVIHFNKKSYEDLIRFIDEVNSDLEKLFLKAQATMSVCRRTVKVDFGVIEFSPDGIFQRYTEKPELEHFVSMGINVFSRDCQKLISRGKTLSMPAFFQRLKDAGHKIVCYTHSDEWLDIGRPDDYAMAQETFEAKKHRFLPKQAILPTVIETL